MSKEDWQEFMVNNLGKLIGITLGLLLGWMIIEYGLFKTLFVIILVVVGYLLGKQADDGESLSSFINRLFRR